MRNQEELEKIDIFLDKVDEKLNKISIELLKYPENVIYRSALYIKKSLRVGNTILPKDYKKESCRVLDSLLKKI